MERCRRVGTIRRMTPVKKDGVRDESRAVLYVGETQVLTPAGVQTMDQVLPQAFGADDLAHPAVNYLHHRAGKVYLGGPITGLTPPVHYDFKGRRDTPNELRAYFRKLGWRRIVAFQTRNPLHRAHQELTFRAG